MNNLTTIIIIFVGSECLGSPITPDTINNWQIYNGTELLLAGNAANSDLKVSIKEKELHDLQIQYNTCVYYQDMNVILEMIDNDDNIRLSKSFKINSGDKMFIGREELKWFNKTTIFKIRLRENKPGGMESLLGEIRIE
jgi:hypothetical protein